MGLVVTHGFTFTSFRTFRRCQWYASLKKHPQSLCSPISLYQIITKFSMAISVAFVRLSLTLRAPCVSNLWNQRSSLKSVYPRHGVTRSRNINLLLLYASPQNHDYNIRPAKPDTIRSLNIVVCHPPVGQWVVSLPN